MAKSGDLVEKYLRELVGELYESITSEADQDKSLNRSRIFEAIASHASYEPLIAAISKDESLVRFFPAVLKAKHKGETANLRAVQSRVTWSDGLSEGMSIPVLAVAMLCAVFRILWTLKDYPTRDEVLDHVPSIISLSRGLAEKHVVKVPQITAIHNITLPDDRELLLGAAIVRQPNRYDNLRLARVASAIGPTVDAILRLEVDFQALNIHDATMGKVEDHTGSSADGFSRFFEEYARDAQHEVDMARLALALSSNPEKLIAPVCGFSATLNPLTDMPSASRSNSRPYQAPYPSQTIDDLVRERLANVACLVQKHARSMDTGVRRLLQAITERLDPEDGLVDAIICWENLFSATPDTVLRVCGAMAKLLGPTEPKARKAFYDQLKQLYNTRNKLVHGSSAIPRDSIYSNRDAAVKYALDALRAVYAREELVSADNSAERALLVLLNL